MNLHHQEPTSSLRSERGQIAIFIALIFQVLFVFFAMIVNIGLIVHDKINLQNSVDLAAYYAAQRQAEILNAIAHENYKIRQAWKLLAFRIRVLGDLGFKEHPMAREAMGMEQDISAFGTSSARSLRVPFVCINHALWGGKSDQNLCYRSDLEIPPLPDDRKTIAPWVITTIIAQMVTQDARNVAGADCAKTGPLNFNLAIRWIQAYRIQIAKSKETIRMYADLLSQNPEDFKDVRGNSVKGGALKTLYGNLTRANGKSLNEVGPSGFRILNSLGGLKREEWLNEVPIYPLIAYADFKDLGGGACRGRNKYISDDKNGLPEHWSGDPTRTVDPFRFEPNVVTDLYHSTFGVEKNPWAMAYVGVYAETKPRKPYLPFGEPITLKAKAFAKPFGGRIGPWYYKKWPQGSLASKGNFDERIDMMAPIPMDVSGKVQATKAQEEETGIPNYSRFPGDTLGLASRASLSAFRKAIYNAKNSQPSKTLNPAQYSGTPAGNDGLAMAKVPEFADLNIPLPLLKYSAPWIREIELAAIAPDLFDITYYSIDRDAYNNYTDQSIKGNLIGNDPPLDIGSMSKEDGGRKDMMAQFLVMDKYADPGAFWFVRNPQHLLTAWAPSNAFQYNFPTDVFGKCPNYDLNKRSSQNVPGFCAQGGRVGYSVKIVSEDYLNSTNLPLGGEGNVGRLKNPPPADF